MNRAFYTILYIGGIALAATSLLSSCAKPASTPWAVASMDPSASTPIPKPHSMHIPQHGGIFFMALDYKHHLEGVLLPSGKFKVYLYDAFTKSLTADKVRETSGTVQVGESADAPIVPLVFGKDPRTLEADLNKQLKLPTTITISLHLPDSKPDARPEVFTFSFHDYMGE
jgi:hypothetical protein